MLHRAIDPRMTPEVVSRIRNMWWNPCNRGKGAPLRHMHYANV